jgi:hypothetical protein
MLTYEILKPKKLTHKKNHNFRCDSFVLQFIIENYQYYFFTILSLNILLYLVVSEALQFE